MTTPLEAKFQPSRRAEGAKLVGDMGGMPDVNDNTVVPSRLPTEADEVLVVPAPSRPTTTRPDGTRLVGDMVSGMPQVEQNRSVPLEGPVEVTGPTTSSLPHRVTEEEIQI